MNRPTLKSIAAAALLAGLVACVEKEPPVNTQPDGDGVRVPITLYCAPLDTETGDADPGTRTTHPSSALTRVSNVNYYLFRDGANSSTVAPDGFANPFTAKQTVLTVVATVDNKIQYYPVVLNSALARNTSYTVGLTITGLGSDDPDKPVTKGSIAVTITVDGWTAGAVYDETI